MGLNAAVEYCSNVVHYGARFYVMALNICEGFHKRKGWDIIFKEKGKLLGSGSLNGHYTLRGLLQRGKLPDRDLHI